MHIMNLQPSSEYNNRKRKEERFYYDKASTSNNPRKTYPTGTTRMHISNRFFKNKNAGRSRSSKMTPIVLGQIFVIQMVKYITH